MDKQEWATVFGLVTLVAIVLWAIYGSPPTWAVVLCFFTGTFFVFPHRLKDWFKALGDLAQRVKDVIPIGGS